MATRAQARRGHVLAAAAALAALAGALLPTASADAASGRCPAGTGVTVVVDYGPLRDGVGLGCDPDGAGKAASEVVPAAGFPVTYVSGEPFVCRISGLPDASQESCARTPPEDAYWALFWSDGKSGTWNYSSSGVASLEVPEGGSIGWRFQDGGARENPGAPPTTAAKSPSPEPSRDPRPTEPTKPPKAADPTPTPTPSASVPPGTVGSGATPGEKANPGGPRKQPARKPDGDQGKGNDGGKGDKTGKGGKGGKDEKQPKDKANPQQAAEPSEAATVAALEPASGEPYADDGSSSALTIVAGGAVLLLAGAAGVIGWRRRA